MPLLLAERTITVRDPAGYAPPSGAAVVPLNLETGWPIVDGTITPRGGKPIRCRMIIDTGVRGTVTLFRPFSERHRLHETLGGITNLPRALFADVCLRG